MRLMRAGTVAVVTMGLSLAVIACSNSASTSTTPNGASADHSSPAFASAADALAAHIEATFGLRP